MKALTKTDFNFPGQKSVYHGKVRDVYNINGEKLVMVATDRISAFDVVLPEGIPYKGQMLNQIAAKFLDATTDICPNWKMATPDPMVTVGVLCEGFPVEMIVRGYRMACLQKRRTRNLRCETTGRNAREPEIPGTDRYPNDESRNGTS